jgi:integrase
VKVPELNTSVFLIPKRIVKNGEERLVVLNRVAASVIEECRGNHPEYFFTWKGGLGEKNRPTKSMNNTSWQTGRASAAKTYGAIFGEHAPAGFANLRVHDLKHTFGRRLRAAGVSLETRKVLLGHKNGNITSHYSAPEIDELIDAANRICETISRKTHALVMLKRKTA